MTLTATPRPALIDLTGPVPLALLACDECGRAAQLYRLLGTTKALCKDCFARRHG